MELSLNCHWDADITQISDRMYCSYLIYNHGSRLHALSVLQSHWAFHIQKSRSHWFWMLTHRFDLLLSPGRIYTVIKLGEGWKRRDGNWTAQRLRVVTVICNAIRLFSTVSSGDKIFFPCSAFLVHLFFCCFCQFLRRIIYYLQTPVIRVTIALLSSVSVICLALSNHALMWTCMGVFVVVVLTLQDFRQHDSWFSWGDLKESVGNCWTLWATTDPSLNFACLPIQWVVESRKPFL